MHFAHHVSISFTMWTIERRFCARRWRPTRAKPGTISNRRFWWLCTTATRAHMWTTRPPSCPCSKANAHAISERISSRLGVGVRAGEGSEPTGGCGRQEAVPESPRHRHELAVQPGGKRRAPRPPCGSWRRCPSVGRFGPVTDYFDGFTVQIPRDSPNHLLDEITSALGECVANETVWRVRFCAERGGEAH